LIDILGSLKEKIDLSNKNIFKKKITKRQLFLKIEELEKQNVKLRSLLESKKDKNYFFYFFISLIIIIVTYLIGLQRSSSFHGSNETK